ncbi:MAG: response regulator, partial [Novosphingobium sp.]
LGLVGVRCLEAKDGASALAHLDRCPDVDLLVTDVGLPGGMNGRQVADEARRRRPDLAVLFVTGYADRINLLENPETANVDVLTKPFGIEDLQQRVAKLLGAAKVSPAP